MIKSQLVSCNTDTPQAITKRSFGGEAFTNVTWLTAEQVSHNAHSRLDKSECNTFSKCNASIS